MRAKRTLKRGFTLIQTLCVVGIVAFLGAIIIPATNKARANSRLMQCDGRLKTLALALNVHHQENGRYPKTLAALLDRKYLKETEALRCPSDPREDASYEDFYVIRSPRSKTERPILVCPFHEDHAQRGAQLYSTSTQTKHFLAQPAVLELANGATVLRPGKDPIAAAAGMPLNGGDRIETSASGLARIRFADDSTAELLANSSATVLQSYIENQSDKLLYTLVRQGTGSVIYTINHGSKFDVVTPTSTAGALGTKFRIDIDADGDTSLTVLEGEVYVVSLTKAALATVDEGLTPLLPDLGDLPLIDSLF